MKRKLFAGVACALLLCCACVLMMSERTARTFDCQAEMLLVQRRGSRQCAVVKDQTVIAELHESCRWQDFHLECCFPEPDFWVYVYQNGERTDTLYGYDDYRIQAYNRAFAQKVRALGKMEPAAWLTEITITAGVPENTAAACVSGALLLPKLPLSRAPRTPTVHASHSTRFEERSQLTDVWSQSAELGAFASDAVFLPLRQALEQEGVLLGENRVRSGRREYSPEPGKTSCERSVTFYVKELPSFSKWDGLEIICSSGRAWDAFIISENLLTQSEWERFAQLGVKRTKEENE